MMVSLMLQSCKALVCAYQTVPVKLSSFKVWLGLLIVYSFSVSTYAGPDEQAKRIYQRLAGTQPSSTVLLQDVNGVDVVPNITIFDAVKSEIAGTDENGDGITGAEGVAMIAMEDDNFYRVTIKNWVAPWTNRDAEVFVPLNDYIATVMGYIRDDRDFRGILSDNALYTATGVASAYSPADNAHYEELEATDPNSFSLKDSLLSNSEANGDAETQASLQGIPNDATAGVMTSRAASEAFFVDGTNRAMLRYTLVNHLCTDLEQLQDSTLPPDRVRQDVSRSPGGDSRVFSNTCVACHGGMDPLAQAFAYYDYAYPSADERPDLSQEEREALGEIEYTGGTVQGKYHINATTFPFGYVTPDDRWSNYWRTGVNRSLGWESDDGSVRNGQGAKSLGQELANSEAFAQCQVRKVFQSVCLRDPINTADLAELSSITTDFKNNGYQLKQTFADVANYCKGS